MIVMPNPYFYLLVENYYGNGITNTRREKLKKLFQQELIFFPKEASRHDFYPSTQHFFQQRKIPPGKLCPPS
jgi:hypothetical protein